MPTEFIEILCMQDTQFFIEKTIKLAKRLDLSTEAFDILANHKKF